MNGPSRIRPLRILGISGSLRERSFNRALLRAAAELVPDGVELVEYDLSDLPLYDGDVEASGAPIEVEELRDAVRTADAMLLTTPEYNRGTSGVLKNAIDWLSRPALVSVLKWKPVAVAGATTGRGATRRAQEQVREALLFPGAVVVEGPEVAIALARDAFDEEGGRLIDEGDRIALAELLEALAEAAREKSPASATPVAAAV
jgi:chromate reductase, NAD(P)H dehydrogenase (quinone)